LVQHAGWVARWNQGIIQVRKRWRVRSASGAAFSWGLISTWLPCGWLYVFAIAAAGAGGVAWGMLLMTAFWVGTLPLLSMVPLGAWWITGRVLSDEAATEEKPHVKPIGWNARLKSLVTSVQPLVQPAAACILIAFGVLTATNRAEISLANLKAPDSNAAQIAPSERLKEAIDQPLPCCQADEASSKSEESDRGDDE
jgi:sulfite exporter TauE/SafE